MPGKKNTELISDLREAVATLKERANATDATLDDLEKLDRERIHDPDTASLEIFADPLSLGGKMKARRIEPPKEVQLQGSQHRS